MHPFRKNLQESDLTSAGNRGIRLLKGRSSWVIHKITLQCTLSLTHKEMTQKPPDPGLEECLSAGVGGQCSLKGLEAKQRAEHVVESHQWTSRDPGNDLDSTLVLNSCYVPGISPLSRSSVNSQAHHGWEPQQIARFLTTVITNFYRKM